MEPTKKRAGIPEKKDRNDNIYKDWKVNMSYREMGKKYRNEVTGEELSFTTLLRILRRYWKLNGNQRSV